MRASSRPRSPMLGRPTWSASTNSTSPPNIAKSCRRCLLVNDPYLLNDPHWIPVGYDTIGDIVHYDSAGTDERIGADPHALDYYRPDPYPSSPLDNNSTRQARPRTNVRPIVDAAVVVN